MNIQLRHQSVRAKPVLKWAGGKTQLLNELLTQVPNRFNRYIEPFIGGGALFFAMQVRSGVIADSNPELINLYLSVADNVEQVIEHLHTFRNTESDFYKTRSLQFTDLENEYAAARTIYLNRTCYNGLYRVNRKGQFNVPFGRYKNPQICQPEVLRAASAALQGTEILCGDYKAVLGSTAKPGDFVFIDPPYMPVSEHADFKRYTKEQFREKDHRELAVEVKRLQELGCHVVLTNSSHPIVHELYKPYDIKVINTRRNISSKAKTRKGEDVVVTVKPSPRFNIRKVPAPTDAKVLAYSPNPSIGLEASFLSHTRDVASPGLSAPVAISARKLRLARARTW